MQKKAFNKGLSNLMRYEKKQQIVLNLLSEPTEEHAIAYFLSHIE